MKKLFTFLLLIGSMHAVKAQRFMHGVGFGIFIVDAPATDLGGFGTLTYSPRFNFLETEAMSVSVGVPLNVGFAGTYAYENYGGYVTEENTLRFMVNAPVMVNLNFGAGSTKANEKRFGLFLGGGFGLHYGDYGVTVIEGGSQYYDTKYGASFGPAANAGFRIAVGRHQKNIETRFSYMKTVTNARTSAYGVGALFNF